MLEDKRHAAFVIIRSPGGTAVAAEEYEANVCNTALEALDEIIPEANVPVRLLCFVGEDVAFKGRAVDFLLRPRRDGPAKPLERAGGVLIPWPS